MTYQIGCDHSDVTVTSFGRVCNRCGAVRLNGVGIWQYNQTKQEDGK